MKTNYLKILKKNLNQSKQRNQDLYKLNEQLLKNNENILKESQIQK